MKHRCLVPCLIGPAVGPVPESIQFSPRSPLLSWRSNLIMFSHLRLGLKSSFCSSEFPPTTLHAPLLSCLPYVPHIVSSHSSRFHCSNNVSWGVRNVKFFLKQFHKSPLTSSHLRRNILLSTYSRIPSASVSRITWEAKFHTNRKQDLKLYRMVGK